MGGRPNLSHERWLGATVRPTLHTHIHTHTRPALPWQEPDFGAALADIRSGKATPFQAIYAWLLSKVASNLEIMPGEEFRAALRAAGGIGAQVLACSQGCVHAQAGCDRAGLLSSCGVHPGSRGGALPRRLVGPSLTPPSAPPPHTPATHAPTRARWCWATGRCR